MNRILSAVLLVGSLSWAASMALAEVAPQASLQSQAISGYYTPTDTLIVALSHAIPLATQQTLSLELDGIDVSALAVFEDAALHYTPAQRMGYGEHTLRLVQYSKGGSVNEWGFWQIDVRQSEHIRQASSQSQLDVSITQRVANYASPSYPNPVGSFSAQGSGQFIGNVEGGSIGNGWGIDGSANLAMADDAEQSLTGRRADIPSFTITAKRGRYSLAAGDQALLPSSLLSSGYQQRGLSASAGLPALDSALTVFSVAANQRIGIDGGLGVSDGDNRVSGFNWQYQPWQSNNADIYVAASVVSGKISDENFGSVDLFSPSESLVNEGRAWNFAVDGQFVQQQFRVRLESANTEYDFDGTDIGFDSVKDDAWSALVLLQPTPKEGEVNLTLGVEAQRLGSYYRSIANNNLPADKKFERVFLNGSRNTAKGGLFWESAYTTEINNLENNSAYAITDMSQWAMSVGYNQFELPKNTFLALLGLPSYSFGVRSVTLRDEYTPVGYIENNLTTDTINVNAAFAHATWNWALGLNEDTVDDKAGWQPNTRTRALQLNTAKKFGEKFYVGLGWQLQKTYFLMQRANTHRQLYSLDANADLIPKKLSVSINVGANQTRALDDPYYAQRDQSTYASGNIIWQVKQPKNHSAGYSLSISVSHNEYNDSLYTYNDTEGLQAFIRLSTSLPSVVPGALQ